MSDITTVKANIANAQTKNTEGIGALEQAKTKAGEAQRDFQRVTEGSDKADVTEARQLAAQAVQKIVEAQQALQASNASADAVKARL